MYGHPPTKLHLTDNVQFVMQKADFNLTYDKNSAKSIYEYSLKLEGKSLSEVADIPAELLNESNKGNLGSLVETYFFKHSPPNDRNPDFSEAGVELKVTGVKKGIKGNYRAKERLVLTMIDYTHLAKETWDTSHLLHKCRKMLIMFNIFDEKLSVIDRRFNPKPILFEIKDGDLEIIKKDWEIIRRKVLDGKAHEISEGDTYFLAACRKGAGGPNEALRKQPFSDVLAQSRAFSLKPSFINYLLSNTKDMPRLDLGMESNFELALGHLFDPFIGKPVQEIARTLDIKGSLKLDKAFNRKIAEKIVTSDGKEFSELIKAGIVMKTIRINKNNRAKESMSFPAFNFKEMLNENWEDSKFYQNIENKFLFVIFKIDENNVESLHKIKLWNMSFEDRQEAKIVWEKTKERLAINSRDFPSIKDSEVAHVRPKARNGRDLAITPQGEMQLKQCFWLNSRYITRVLLD